MHVGNRKAETLKMLILGKDLPRCFCGFPNLAVKQLSHLVKLFLCLRISFSH